MIHQMGFFSYYSGRKILVNDVTRSLGRSLRAFRVGAKLTQEQLAFAAGLNRNYISSLELGQKEASLATVFRLATALGISATQLVNAVVIDIEKESEGS